MAKHYNLSLVSWLNRLFRFKGDFPSHEVSELIMPVVCLEPTTTITKVSTNSATGTVTAYTTPTDKDFFLTGIFFSFDKNATADNTTFTISATQDGEVKTLISVLSLTTTARQIAQYIPFEKPFKVDRGTAIQHTATFTAGAMSRSVIVHGYTQETLTGTSY